MDFKDYYATLGVSKTASQKEIKAAYRKLAKDLHPDRNPGNAKSEARFKEVGEAYAVLGDAGKRKKYDELGANWRAYEQAQQSGQGFSGGWPPGGFAVDFGEGGGATRMSVEDMQDLFGEEHPFSDFFTTFFGGGGGPQGPRAQRAPRPRRGRDIEHGVDLTLEEVARGATRKLALKTGGHARTIEVRIPAGVKDGTRVRAAGEGEGGTSGAASGDLYLRVHVVPHPVFERAGDDLRARVKVPLTTAVLGGEAEAPALDGRRRLRIAPGTQPGQVFRLRGEGLPAVGRDGARGDLYATVEVTLPHQLTDEEREHYEALKKLNQ